MKIFLKIFDKNLLNFDILIKKIFIFCFFIHSFNHILIILKYILFKKK